MHKLRLTALVATSLCLLPACPGESDDDTTTNTTPATTTMTTAGPSTPTTGEPDSTSTGDPDTTAETSTDPSTTTGGLDGQLCTDLGGTAGIGQLVDEFLAAVLTDPRVNAYFLRNDLEFGPLRQCIIDQLGAAAECNGVAYTCKDMKTAHESLGISTQDFTDFAEDFGAAWDKHKASNAPNLTDDQKTAVIMLLAGMAPDIVEDVANDVTVYQRIGRKPAVEAVIGDPMTPGSFVANVAADPSIVGFFTVGPSDFVRLKTCLVRQVIGVAGGPQTYGLERSDNPPGVDPGPTMEAPCLDMVTSHVGLVDDMGVGIETADFMALVVALANAMTTAGVDPADQNLIAGPLNALCPMIVSVDPMNCM